MKGVASPQLPGVRRQLPPSAAASWPSWSVAHRHSSRRQSPSPARRFPVSPCSPSPLGRVRWFPTPSSRFGCVGFQFPSFPGSFDVLRLSGQRALTQLFSIYLYCCVHIMCRCVSLLPTLGHLYLDFTAGSWSRTLWGCSLIGASDQTGTQAASPRLCSSTPILLPQECCERRSFLPACAPAALQ